MGCVTGFVGFFVSFLKESEAERLSMERQILNT